MKILLLDIETAPNKVYVWGLWNQNVSLNQIVEAGYTMCWAAKWVGGKEMMFASLHEDGERKMLEKIYSLIEEADAVIHYNGSRFDMPTLNQEFLRMGWSPPAPYINIDLLSTARRRFRLLSNKLNYVAQYLGLGSKVEHKGMELWTKCMDGDDKSWRLMERYNKQDVKLLEKVYNILLSWIPNHPNHALFNNNIDTVCPNCGGKHLNKRGFYYTKTLSYQRYRCKDCGTWSRARTNNMDAEKRKNVLVGVV